MKINSSKRNLSIVLILFPPLVLLIYAVVSYYINFYTHSETISIIKKNYLNSRESIDKRIIKSKALMINNFINTTDGNKKALLEYLKDLYVEDYEDVLLFNRENKIIFRVNPAVKISSLFPFIKSASDGFYSVNEFSLYIQSKNVLQYKIVSILSNRSRFEHYRNEMHSILELYKRSTHSHLWWLAIVFVVLLGLSIVISRLIYNKLKEYEKSVQFDNSKIIFQSRQALLGELLPMIAHQWRQPLNKIAAVLMRMRFEISSGKPKVETLDMQCQSIENSVELMSQTIDDFRSFYRPKEKPQEVDLALLIRKAVYFLDELLNRKKISIHTNLTQTKIKLHSNEFLQVIINLIKNASDAVSVQGHIYITLTKLPDGSAEIRIEDDGIGIPKDKLEKIFEPHESSKQGSMGLGLYMSRIIIEQHFGGKIKAYNTSRGAGFYIFIPKQ